VKNCSIGDNACINVYVDIGSQTPQTVSRKDGVTKGQVNVERRDRVAIVTIASPENRNALTTKLLLDLSAALEELDADRTISVAVLTGGTQLFASGADVRALLEVDPAEYARSPRADCWRRLNGLGLPLVAAVAGVALGGGCELAFLADIVVASDTALFGQPEVRLGLIPGAGGTQRWARVAGRHVATDVVLTGRTVDAFEARDLGLVARVVPAERVVEAAAAVAARLAAGAPLALRAARASIRAADELPLATALEAERERLVAVLATEDRVEGITAFLEKRAPRFTGQ
jgi:enoyl-CoA hydratase